jgi:hypothetical protein
MRRLTLDHIRMRRNGGSDERRNMRAICCGCHVLVTAVEEIRGRSFLGRINIVLVAIAPESYAVNSICGALFRSWVRGAGCRHRVWLCGQTSRKFARKLLRPVRYFVAKPRIDWFRYTALRLFGRRRDVPPHPADAGTADSSAQRRCGMSRRRSYSPAEEAWILECARGLGSSWTLEPCMRTSLSIARRPAIQGCA